MMLDHKQFRVIMDRVDLTKIDLILLSDHLIKIENTCDEYGSELPLDVLDTLNRDISDIVDRLQMEYKKLKDKSKSLTIAQ